MAAALDGGDVACIQLRLKNVPDDDIRRACDILRPVAQDREVSVVITKARRDERVGITLTEDEHGVTVVSEVAGPPALAHGKLDVGDLILAVNEVATTGHAETTSHLKSLQGRVVLHVRKRR